MSEQDRTEDTTRRYVDRQRAMDMQEEREGGDASVDATPPSRGHRDRRRLRDRLADLLGGGRQSSAVIVVAGLCLAGCSSTAGGASSTAPSASLTSRPTATADDISGTTTCVDATGDVHALEGVELPTDGDGPNVRAADLPNVSIEAYANGIALTFVRDDPGAPPTGTVRHTLWMRGEDGSSGLVRASWDASPTSDAMDVRGGPGPDDLSEIQGVRPTVHPHRTTIIVPYDGLPVDPPFTWAVEHAILPTGVADMCPNVDPDDPLADPAGLPTFPEDEEVVVGDGPTIEVIGRNYTFEAVPATAEVGTRLQFRNESDEPHEIVLLALTDDAPPVEDFVRMPRQDAEQFVARQVGTSIAMPGQPGVLRDGDLVLDEPGTYVLLCPLPTGVTPEHVNENFDGPPAPGEQPSEFGPPHLTQGMFAAIEVE